jgi:hypothetical protein
VEVRFVLVTLIHLGSSAFMSRPKEKRVLYPPTLDIFNTVPMTTPVVWWSEFQATDPEALVLFPALPDFLKCSGSRTGSTQLREYN